MTEKFHKYREKSGLVIFGGMIFATQYILLAGFENSVYAGMILVAWGFFLLLRLLHFASQKGEEKDYPGEKHNNLPRVLLQSIRTKTIRVDKSVWPRLSNPLLLGVFLPGMIFCLLSLGHILSPYTGIALHDLASLKTVLLCGIVFWIAQGYSGDRQDMRLLYAFLFMCCAGAFLAILISKETTLTFWDFEWLAYGALPETAFFERYRHLGAFANLCIYAAGAACCLVYFFALMNRRRDHIFLVASLCVLGVTAFADLYISYYPGMEAFWVSVWALLGAGWAQIWPSGKRHALLMASKS